MRQCDTCWKESICRLAVFNDELNLGLTLKNCQHYEQEKNSMSHTTELERCTSCRYGDNIAVIRKPGSDVDKIVRVQCGARGREVSFDSVKVCSTACTSYAKPLETLVSKSQFMFMTPSKKMEICSKVCTREEAQTFCNTFGNVLVKYPVGLVFKFRGDVLVEG